MESSSVKTTDALTHLPFSFSSSPLPKAEGLERWWRVSQVEGKKETLGVGERDQRDYNITDMNDMSGRR